MPYESGMRFGRVVLVSKLGIKQWTCLCDCGVTVQKWANNLPRTKGCGHSCGLSLKRKHGGTGTKEYHAWTDIKYRCFNPNHPRAKDYSGRGIGMHPEWKDDFAAFFAYVGSAPSSAHALDRIDNDKGYEPGNVRWVTTSENNNNRRNNVTLTYKGETKTAAEWAKELGMDQKIIRRRVHRGWTVEDALNTPLKTSNEGI